MFEEYGHVQTIYSVRSEFPNGTNGILISFNVLPMVPLENPEQSHCSRGNGSFRPRVVSAQSCFGPGSFRPGSIRLWVVSAQFGGSFRPIFLNYQACYRRSTKYSFG